MSKYLIIFASIIFLTFFLLGTQKSFADGFEAPINKLIHNPTICAFEPPNDPQFLGVGGKLLSQTEDAVLDWQQKLNQGYGKHPAWNMNFIKVPLNMQSGFDVTKCDITVHFKREPDNPTVKFLEAGVTKPDIVNHKADVEVYYLGVDLEWQANQYQQGSYIVTVYTPTLYYTGYLAPDPQLQDTIRHELGHAFGLGHYILPSDKVYQITRGQFDSPSIMITTVIGYGITQFDITPNDINEMKLIYSYDGFGGFKPTQSKSISTINQNQSLAKIPDWIKNNAKWWAEGSVSDGEFTKGIEYLIQQGMMKIPQTQSGSISSQKIPLWAKTNAGWWASGQISDDEFVRGIQYLITVGIIQLYS